MDLPPGSAQRGEMKRGLLAAGAIAILPMPSLARQGPESLDQVEPGGGEVQLQWLGDFGGAGEQGFELLFGLTDELAVGAEAEFEGPRDGLMFEEASAVVLWRIADPDDAPVGLGLMGEVAIDRGGRLSGIEARGCRGSRRAASSS